MFKWFITWPKSYVYCGPRVFFYGTWSICLGVVILSIFLKFGSKSWENWGPRFDFLGKYMFGSGAYNINVCFKIVSMFDWHIKFFMSYHFRRFYDFSVHLLTTLFCHLICTIVHTSIWHFRCISTTTVRRSLTRKLNIYNKSYAQLLTHHSLVQQTDSVQSSQSYQARN